MHWLRALGYVFSPLVVALLVGVILDLKGIWFFLIVLGGLVLSIVNSVLVSLKVMR